MTTEQCAAMPAADWAVLVMYLDIAHEVALRLRQEAQMAREDGSELDPLGEVMADADVDAAQESLPHQRRVIHSARKRY